MKRNETTGTASCQNMPKTQEPYRKHVARTTECGQIECPWWSWGKRWLGPDRCGAGYPEEAEKYHYQISPRYYANNR